MSRSNHRRAKPPGKRDRDQQPAGRRALRRSQPTGRSRGVRVLKVAGAVAALGFAGGVVMCGVAYAMTEIPPPKEAAKSQATVIKWRDGSKMATLGAQQRFHVEMSRIPDHLEKAVLSAENRDFYNQPLGISPTGTARALWVNLTSGDLQGGSTITQQFAQNMYLDTGRTLTIKFKELFLALKLEQKMSKDAILEGYLNTIYFGRGGTYGVEAASRTYFHKHVGQLTVSESAFLAAVLNSPGNYDPYEDGKIDKQIRRAAVERWEYVIDGMVERGWLSVAKAQQLRFPKIYPPRDDGDTYGGPRGYILKRIEHVLTKQMGFSRKEVFTAGLTVRTTLNKQMQRAASRAVRETLPKNWPYSRAEVGLVSVQPGTGEVLAAYGGRNYLKDQFGNVYRAKAQPGSSFKPYVLAAALEDGTGLRSRFDGNSPQTFRGSYEVQNSDHIDWGMTDLLGATKHSVNTVYVRLGLKTGIDNVIDAAVDAGLPRKALPEDASISLGTASLHPVNHAAGIASFAAKGMYAEPHLLLEVRDAKGNVLEKVAPDPHRAFPEDIAADVAYAMQQVAEPGGTGDDAALGDRPIAGKTGTTQDNHAAWFVGYTPQVATAVAMFHPDNEPLTNLPVYGTVSGPSAPVDVWHAYMAEVMEGRPVKDFPEPEWVGETFNPVPPPTPDPTPTGTPSPRPTTPSPTPTPTTPTPKPSEPRVPPPPSDRPTGDPEPTPSRPGDGDEECIPFCTNENPGGRGGGSGEHRGGSGDQVGDATEG